MANDVDPDRLSWSEFVGTCRRSVGLCREASSTTFAMLVASAVLVSFMPAALAGSAGLVVNQVEKMIGRDEASMLALLPWLGLVAGVLATQGILASIRGYFENRLAADMDLVLSKMVLDHRVVMDMEFFDRPENHDLLQRGAAVAGFEFLKFIMQLVTTGALAIQFITLFCVMMWILPVVTPILGLVAIPMFWFRWRISRMQYQINLQKTSRNRLRDYYTNELTDRASLPTVKIFGLAPLLVVRFDKLTRELITLDRRLFLKRALGQVAGHVAFAIGFVIAAGWAAWSTLSGQLAVGALVTYLASADRLRNSLQGMTTAAQVVFTSVLNVRNLYKFFDVEPSIDSHPQRAARQRTGAVDAPERARGEIELDHVSFSYPGASTETLHDINLHIMPGETIALVGGNGAGKTTLANLILRFYDPTSGVVRVDGVDAREYSTEWLYRQIGYVSQAPVRFEMSAAENIAFADYERLRDQPEELARIARSAGIESIIDKMPRGLDTILGRRFGEYEMSGGEWQRFGVARALAKEAPIVVFDEPTANMDAHAEYELFTALKEMVKERTAIIVSHRFATVRSADRIVVLDEGRVAEVGSHEELIAMGGIYAGLYEIQQEALNG